MASPAKQTAKQRKNLPKVIVDAIARKKGNKTKGGKRKPSPGLKRGYKCKK
jgi:hypothetical protein